MVGSLAFYEIAHQAVDRAATGSDLLHYRSALFVFLQRPFNRFNLRVNPAGACCRADRRRARISALN